MVKAGTFVQIKTKWVTYTGTLMPSPDKNTIILKLASGYNIGFEAKDVKIKKLKEAEAVTFPSIKAAQKRALPKLSLITTGGTITSKVDYKTGAVYPLTKPEELLFNIPELTNLAQIKIIKPFSLLSEDLTPKEWQKIAEITAKELNSGARGVIITHGTDTLHFTASALSFMLKDLGKPVALVGGQRSSDRGSFDGALNLICAVHYCLANAAEVAVVMHGTEEDTFCLANRGVKCRKMHSSRRDTFRPINELPLMKIWKDGKIKVLNKNYKKRTDGKVKVDSKFEEKVALIKAYPGASPDIIDFYINKKYKGLIVEATGMGHVPTQPLDKKNSWLPAIKSAIAKGIFVGFAPQTLYGRLDPFVYRNARLMHQAGVCYLEDMLPEVAYTKLGWALAHSKSLEETKKLMITNVAGEVTKKISPGAFLY